MSSVTSSYAGALILASMAALGAAYLGGKATAAVKMPDVKLPSVIGAPAITGPTYLTEEEARKKLKPFADDAATSAMFAFVKTPVKEWQKLKDQWQSLRTLIGSAFVHPDKCPAALTKICELVYNKFSQMNKAEKGELYDDIGDQWPEFSDLVKELPDAAAPTEEVLTPIPVAPPVTARAAPVVEAIAPPVAPALPELPASPVVHAPAPAPEPPVVTAPETPEAPAPVPELTEAEKAELEKLQGIPLTETPTEQSANQPAPPEPTETPSTTPTVPPPETPEAPAPVPELTEAEKAELEKLQGIPLTETPTEQSANQPAPPEPGSIETPESVADTADLVGPTPHIDTPLEAIASPKPVVDAWTGQESPVGEDTAEIERRKKEAEDEADAEAEALAAQKAARAAEAEADVEKKKAEFEAARAEAERVESERAAAKKAADEAAKAEDAARKDAEEIAKRIKDAEDEADREAEELARQRKARQEESAKAAAAAQAAQRKADEDAANQRAAEEAKRRADAEREARMEERRARQAEDAAKRAREKADRQAAQEAARLKAEEDTKRAAAEAAAAEERRKKAQAEAAAAEEQQKKMEIEAARRALEDAQRAATEERRKQAAERRRIMEETERLARQQADARKQLVEEASQRDTFIPKEILREIPDSPTPKELDNESVANESMTSSMRRRLGPREPDLPKIGGPITMRNKDAVLQEITTYIKRLRRDTSDNERVNVARTHLLYDFNKAVSPTLKQASVLLGQAKNKINGAARRTQRRQPDHS